MKKAKSKKITTKDKNIVEKLKKQKYKRLLSQEDLRSKSFKVFLECIKLGLPLKPSLQVSGLNKKTLYHDILKDEANKNLYLEARNEAHKKLVDKLYKKAMKGDLKAIMFFLERRFPQYWARRDNIKIKSKNENTNTIEFNEKVLNDILNAIKNDIGK